VRDKVASEGHRSVLLELIYKHNVGRQRPKIYLLSGTSRVTPSARTRSTSSTLIACLSMRDTGIEMDHSVRSSRDWEDKWQVKLKSCRAAA
jgi:hypothetical protein